MATFDFTAEELVGIGFVDLDGSFRLPILQNLEFALYWDEPFLRLQTRSSGWTLRLEHIYTIDELKQFIQLLTGKAIAG